METCDRIKNFINNNWALILIAAVSALVLILCLTHYFECRCSIIDGMFILFSALVTSMFAIHKYQSEQRTARLQKIYFEETFLDEAKSIESTLSQTNNNFLNVENLCNLSVKILDQN